MNKFFHQGRIFIPVLIAVLIFQASCARQTTGLQKIPVTSNPVQARISVDGQETGFTPLTLTLERDRNHIIKIEKEGYEPVLIRVQPGTTGKISNFERIMAGLPLTIAGMCLGTVVGLIVSPTDDSTGHKYASFVIGAALVGATPGIMILARKSQPVLEPGVINIVLKRLPENRSAFRPVQTILLTSEKLRSLRWIRISCEGN